MKITIYSQGEMSPGSQMVLEAVNKLLDLTYITPPHDAPPPAGYNKNNLSGNFASVTLTLAWSAPHRSSETKRQSKPFNSTISSFSLSVCRMHTNAFTYINPRTTKGSLSLVGHQGAKHTPVSSPLTLILWSSQLCESKFWDYGFL